MNRWYRPLSVCTVLCGALLAWAADKDDTPRVKLSKEEQAILDLTNQAREKEKLPPLKANAVLTEVARAHSANMAKKGELKHVLDDKTPAQRVSDAGYEFRAVGENIAWGEGMSPRDIFKLWMGSEHHRENILREGY